MADYMRTNYNDSNGRNGGRYTKRQNTGVGGRRTAGTGRRTPAQRSANGTINVAGMAATRNKYLEMAKEELANGNRVEAENYFQHAEHYSKVLNAAMAVRRGRDDYHDSGYQQRDQQRDNGGNEGENYAEKPADNAGASDSESSSVVQ